MASSASTSASISTSLCSTIRTVTFREYLDDQIKNGSIDSDLCDVVVGVARSCAEVSDRLKTHTLDFRDGEKEDDDVPMVATTVNVQGEQQKGMDVVANDIFIRNLDAVQTVAAMASEEEEAVIYANGYGDSGSGDKSNGEITRKETCYEIAFDPLDGSGNLDVNLPTGSIFGIAGFQKGQGRPFSQPGSALVASGYAVYSASTELVVSFGTDHPDGVVGFTLLDNQHQHHQKRFTDEEGGVLEFDSADRFVLSRSTIRCPDHGPYYSLNEAREPDWPDGLKRWISDAKRGLTNTKKTYSSRYVCSLCADLHRTLLQGGWAGNPRPHLRLLYEAAPLAFLIEAAGGKGSDGTQNLLAIEPRGLHDRVCVFLGSKDDINDLESYGDVQQVRGKRYEA